LWRLLEPTPCTSIYPPATLLSTEYSKKLPGQGCGRTTSGGHRSLSATRYPLVCALMHVSATYFTQICVTSQGSAGFGALFQGKLSSPYIITVSLPPLAASPSFSFSLPSRQRLPISCSPFHQSPSEWFVLGSQLHKLSSGMSEYLAFQSSAFVKPYISPRPMADIGRDPSWDC
jgi:hypothetical protein